MTERVVVTGIGVLTNLGSNKEEFWQNLISGKSGISELSSLDSSSFNCKSAGEIKDFNPEGFIAQDKIKDLTRSCQLTISASLLALRDAKMKPSENDIGLVLGSLAGGMEIIEKKNYSFAQYPVYMLAANVCNELKIKGPVFSLSCACASGNYALSLAYEKIKNKEIRMILSGGADSFIRSVFVGFHRLFAIAPFKCQPFDKNRKGMIPSEGAGILVLEALSSAKQRGAHIYAEILGYGVSCDAYHPVLPQVEGVYNCMKESLEQTGLNPSDIDYINAHGTGTLQNDKVECQAIRKLFGKKTKRIPISSIKSMLGHSMGASSAIEAAACCLSLEKEMIPPTINYESPDAQCDIDCVPNQAREKKLGIILNNSFGFGGINCSLVIKRWRE